MSCYYELNGHRFNSEIELDDYLLTKHHYKSKLGDIVFSLSADLLFAVDKLNTAKEESDKLLDIFEQGLRLSAEDRKSIEYKAPYIGVNKYISQYRDELNNLLCPEFRADEYWERRYDAWKQGNYTDNEKELFFPDGNVIKIADRQLAITRRLLMENKWENQALAGDAVHSILEAYFSTIEYGLDGSPVYAKDKLKTDLLYKEEFKNKLKALEYKRKDKVSIKKFSDILSDKLIDEIISKCVEFENYLNVKFPGALFYPEFRIAGKVAKAADNGVDTLLGIIDLLVIDLNGCPHVIDYKTSPKPYEKFDTAKQLAYKYQMGVYGKLLAKCGLATSNTTYHVTPIQLADFLKVDDDLFTFSGINMLPEFMDNLTHELYHPFNGTNRSVMDNLDEFIETPYVVDISTEKVIENVTKAERILFPGFSLFKQYTDELIRDEIAEADGFTKNEESGKYEFKPKGSLSNYVITADTEEELFEKVKKHKEWLPKQRANLTKDVKDGLKEGIKQGSAEGIEFPEMYSYGNVGVSTNWFKTKMARYCNQRWEVCEGKNFLALEEFGIITLFNRSNQLFNFVKITTGNPKYIFNFSKDEKRMNLAGAFKTDLEYQSKNDSLMLLAAQGNVELMETMLVINNIKQAFGNNAMVGDIEVMNPVYGFGLGASNKELLYCFNELHEAAKDKLEIPNNFKNGSIQLASKAWSARAHFKDIMAIGADRGWKEEYSKFKNFTGCMTQMDSAITLPKDLQIKALQELLKQLSKTEGNRDLVNVLEDLSVLSQEHVALYNQALLALAELKGIDFRQLLKEHDKWVESLMIHKVGLSGLYLDNPGNLQSETLNLLTKLVTQAYQGVRQDMQEPVAKIRELTEALKKEKNIGWIGEHTVVNLADLYKNLYRDDIKDDLVFKNPWSNASSLTTAERNFLKYALTEINKNRFNGISPEAYQNSFDTKYFRVPLTKGDSSAFASKKGLLAALKEKLSGLTPQKAWEDAKAKTEGIFDELDSASEKNRRDSENLFEMSNIFDKGESEDRLDYIAKKGLAYFESNLETLLLKHQFAYSVKDHIDDVMPMIKAAVVHLTTQGAILNTKFEKDILYAKDYIRNKIKNESIIDPKYEKAAAVAEKVKGAASKMALAFSPVQAIYQTLQGIWNDISLIIRKPDGSMAFTFKNMIKAAKLVYSDLYNIDNKPTITSLMNELYGINDMDMNTYIDRIKSDQHGIHNLSSLMFKFASRPDYYNRMTMFLAKVIADGALEAHSIKDGKLVYDSKLDKRYSAFLNNPNNPNVPGYAEAKARYYAAAKQFIKEGALFDEEGNPIVELDMKHPVSLPRAYTNLEAESMKSLSDTIYGYYSHEKKSMVQSTLLGSMWMQFKTFWSGKKNLYLQTGGVKLEGQWVPFKDAEGKQWYYQVDEDGTVREDLEPTLEDTGMPVMRWEGNWKEGILSTVFDLANGVVHGQGKEAWDKKWNAEDPKLRLAYRSNLKQLGYDLIIWALIGGMAAGALGDWLEDEKKKASKDDFMEGVRLAMMNIMVKSVRNSALDFNFIDSIGGLGTTWTPFSFEYLGRQVSNVYLTALGEKDIWSTIINSNSAMRQTKPMWDTLNPKNRS